MEVAASGHGAHQREQRHEQLLVVPQPLGALEDEDDAPPARGEALEAVDEHRRVLARVQRRVPVGRARPVAVELVEDRLVHGARRRARDAVDGGVRHLERREHVGEHAALPAARRPVQKERQAALGLREARRPGTGRVGSKMMQMGVWVGVRQRA